MAGVKPYSLTQAQELVTTARSRYSARNERRGMERLLAASGSLDEFAAAAGLAADTATAVLREKLNVAPETINRILPALTLQHASITPKMLDLDVVATAGGDDMDDRALVARHQLDYLWYKADGLQTVSQCVWDYLVIGEMVGKVAYERVVFDEPTSEKEQSAAYGHALGAALDVATEHGTTVSAIAAPHELQDAVPLTKQVVERDGVVISYVDPCDFYVDEHASNLRDARWVAQRFVLPLDEVAANADFSHTDELTPDGPHGAGALTPRGARAVGGDVAAADDPTLTCVVWEFYDCRTRTLLIFQESSSKPLYDGAWPYEFRGLPFVHDALYREKPSDMHGFGEVRNIAALQVAYNEGVALQLENARLSAAHKYFYNKNVLDMDDETRASLESSVPGEVVGVDISEGIPVEQVIKGWQPNPLSSDVYQMNDALKDGIAASLGQNDFEQGGVGVSHMSGTAASLVAGTSTTRAADKVSAVERFTARISQLALAFFREYMGESQQLRVNGQRGSVEVTVTPDLLDGEFDVRVTSASESKNEASRKQDALDILNVVAPALTNAGYDTEPLMRRAMTLMNLDPDTYLKRLPPAPPAPAGPAAAAGPQMPPAEMTAGPQDGQPAALPTQPEPQLGPQSEVGGLAQDAQLGGGIAL